jgi:hypothetical protein
VDKIALYREMIQKLLTTRAESRSPQDPVTSQTIFDLQNDHYQMVNLGWKNGSTHIETI